MSRSMNLRECKRANFRSRVNILLVHKGYEGEDIWILPALAAVSA